MTLGGERFSSTHTKPHAPLSKVIATATTRSRTLTELVSPFKKWTGGLRSSAISENLRRILKPKPEPCFKASMPSYSSYHEIGYSQGRKEGLTGLGPSDAHTLEANGHRQRAEQRGFFPCLVHFPGRSVFKSQMHSIDHRLNDPHNGTCCK
jgi:hypothetical protein